MGKRKPHRRPPSPKVHHCNTHFNHFHRRTACTICNESHHETECPHRGAEWRPKWLVQNVTKYNAIHKDQPHKKIIEVDPPLRYPNIKNHKSHSKAVIDHENDDGMNGDTISDKSTGEDNSNFHDTI